MNENGKVRILMGTYFSLNCISLSYVVLYLGMFGLQDSTIGTIVSISAVIGFILQGILGRIIDTHPKWYWRNLLIVLGVLELIVCVLILIGQLINIGALMLGGLYAVFIIITLGMGPLVNISSFYYTAHGRPVNFGVARGVGSLVFAAVSYIIGIFTDQMGIIYIPIFGVVVSILFIFSTIILPNLGSTYGSGDNEPSKTSFISRDFIIRNKYFILMAIGICMVLILHNIVNSFLIRMIEHVGENSDELGLALAIAAVSELPVLFLYERFVKKFNVSTQLLIFVACLFFVLRGILYLFATNVLFIYAVQILQSVSFALLIASKTHFADEGVGKEDKATGQSIMSMTEAVAMVLGSAVGGWALSLGGINMMYTVGIVFAVLGSLLVLAVYLPSRNSPSAAES
ncbi:MFS transporter [Methanobrevibacter sp.]|uniref:MFS transporter n=1 Tax=Methanobrevibacter sp. TaxID=66852 RepID=UPI00388E3757